MMSFNILNENKLLMYQMNEFDLIWKLKYFKINILPSLFKFNPNVYEDWILILIQRRELKTRYLCLQKLNCISHFTWHVLSVNDIMQN